jgi:hypothetical protein
MLQQHVNSGLAILRARATCRRHAAVVDAVDRLNGQAEPTSTEAACRTLKIDCGGMPMIERAEARTSGGVMVGLSL